MNTRMNELSKEATAYCDTLDIADQSIYKSIWEREFGELIVRECADIADTDLSPKGVGCGYITYTTGERIKKHFGVES